MNLVDVGLNLLAQHRELVRRFFAHAADQPIHNAVGVARARPLGLGLRFARRHEDEVCRIAPFGEHTVGLGNVRVKFAGPVDPPLLIFVEH